MEVLSEPAEFPTKKYDTTNRPKTKGRRVHRAWMGTAPFVAWDGEGYSDDTGEHHYMLFGSSNGESVKGESLTWRECFPLLLDSQDGINVIYGGDYDIIMMTRTMPFPVRQRLYSARPVKYDGYRMVWFRRKFLHIKHYASGRSVTLYDVLSFFQTSFVKACREYLGNDETLDAMQEMKLKRDSFTLGDDSVDPYWQSELDYLVRLMTLLRELMAEVGIKPRGWYGPGAVASALLSQHKMGEHYHPIPDEIVDVAERAYYGGRFEQFKVGAFDKAYQYDIRSAYPDAIIMLPSFKDVEWIHEDSPTNISPYGFYEVSWDIPFKSPTIPGPLPWRSQEGNIYYPLKGCNSWYCGIEILFTLRYFPKEFYTIHQGYYPEGRGGIRPFRSWVEDMYDQRAEMKRQGNPAQKALKLGLNSLYGKLAQSTGSKRDEDGNWIKPKWHHVVWASYITAATRAKLYEKMFKNQANLIAVETDAIFVTEPIKDEDIHVDDKLGHWDMVELDRILYVHSGVYYALKDGVWKLRSRGVEVDKSKSADWWEKIFERLPQETIQITVKVRRFGTDIRQPERFSRWFDHTATQSMPNTMSKRMHFPKLCPVCFLDPESSYADCGHSLVVPQGALQCDWQASTPYKFPWRTDARYDWSLVDGVEVLELPEDITWQ